MKIGRKHFGVLIFCSEGQHGVKISLHRWSLIKENNKKGGGIRCDDRVKCSKKTNISWVVLSEMNRESGLTIATKCLPYPN